MQLGGAQGGAGGQGDAQNKGAVQAGRWRGRGDAQEKELLKLGLPWGDAAPWRVRLGVEVVLWVREVLGTRGWVFGDSWGMGRCLGWGWLGAGCWGRGCLGSGGCSGRCWGWGDAWGGGAAPCPRSRSLKRASEEKEQRLVLLEDGRAAADREVTELRATLREVERARLDARRELQELRRQVRRRRMVGTPPVTHSRCHQAAPLFSSGR